MGSSRPMRDLVTKKEGVPNIMLWTPRTSAQMLTHKTQVCKDKNLKIPEDIAVMGFDNVRMSNLVEPKLTTIEVPLHKLGVYGARLLFDLIEGEEDGKEAKTILLQHKIKIRQCHFQPTKVKKKP